MGLNCGPARKALIVYVPMDLHRDFWRQRAEAESQGLSIHPPVRGVAHFGWMNSRLWT